MGLSREMLFDTVIIGICVLIAIIVITHRDPWGLKWSGKIQEVAVTWKELEEEKASTGKDNSSHQG